MTEETYEDGNEGNAGLNNLDFNVTDEYKPEPKVPNGTYHGVVTNVSFNSAKSTINWSICLHDNGGVLSDNETPLDGAYVSYTNMLPLKGDENLMIKSGKMTKRQWKINALSEFAEALSLDMSTPQAILQALEEAQWIGLEVDIDVEIQEYNGKFNSRVKLGEMRKSSMY